MSIVIGGKVVSEYLIDDSVGEKRYLQASMGENRGMEDCKPLTGCLTPFYQLLVPKQNLRKVRLILKDLNKRFS